MELNGMDPTRDPNVIDSMMNDGFDITDPTAGSASSQAVDSTTGKVLSDPIYNTNPVLLNVPPPDNTQSADSVANAEDVQRKLRRMGRVSGM